MLYLNGELVKEATCKRYSSKLEYDENTIGCALQFAHIDKEGEEKLKDNFKGIMSALYFIEVSPTNVHSTHAFLARAHTRMHVEELALMLGYRQEEVFNLLAPWDNQWTALWLNDSSWL